MASAEFLYTNSRAFRLAYPVTDVQNSPCARSSSDTSISSYNDLSSSTCVYLTNGHWRPTHKHLYSPATYDRHVIKTDFLNFEGRHVEADPHKPTPFTQNRMSCHSERHRSAHIPWMAEKEIVLSQPTYLCPVSHLHALANPCPVSLVPVAQRYLVPKPRPGQAQPLPYAHEPHAAQVFTVSDTNTKFVTPNDSSGELQEGNCFQQCLPQLAEHPKALCRRSKARQQSDHSQPATTDSQMSEPNNGKSPNLLTAVSCNEAKPVTPKVRKGASCEYKNKALPFKAPQKSSGPLQAGPGTPLMEVQARSIAGATAAAIPNPSVPNNDRQSTHQKPNADGLNRSQRKEAETRAHRDATSVAELSKNKSRLSGYLRQAQQRANRVRARNTQRGKAGTFLKDAGHERHQWGRVSSGPRSRGLWSGTARPPTGKRYPASSTPSTAATTNNATSLTHARFKRSASTRRQDINRHKLSSMPSLLKHRGGDTKAEGRLISKTSLARMPTNPITGWELSNHEILQSNNTEDVLGLKAAVSRCSPHSFDASTTNTNLVRVNSRSLTNSSQDSLQHKVTSETADSTSTAGNVGCQVEESHDTVDSTQMRVSSQYTSDNNFESSDSHNSSSDELVKGSDQVSVLTECGSLQLQKPTQPQERKTKLIGIVPRLFADASVAMERDRQLLESQMEEQKRLSGSEAETLKSDHRSPKTQFGLSESDSLKDTTDGNGQKRLHHARTNAVAEEKEESPTEKTSSSKASKVIEQKTRREIETRIQPLGLHSQYRKSQHHLLRTLKRKLRHVGRARTSARLSLTRASSELAGTTHRGQKKGKGEHLACKKSTLSPICLFSPPSPPCGWDQATISVLEQKVTKHSRPRVEISQAAQHNSPRFRQLYPHRFPAPFHRARSRHHEPVPLLRRANSLPASILSKKALGYYFPLSPLRPDPSSNHARVSFMSGSVPRWRCMPENNLNRQAKSNELSQFSDSESSLYRVMRSVVVRQGARTMSTACNTRLVIITSRKIPINYWRRRQFVFMCLFTLSTCVALAYILTAAAL